MLQALERVIIDPISENPLNSPLEITGENLDEGHGLYAGAEKDLAPADRQTLYVAGAGIEGERKVATGQPRNRRLSWRLWEAEASQAIAAATNLISNPSFEKGVTGWSGLGAGVTIASLPSTSTPAGESVGYVSCPGTVAGEGIQLSPDAAVVAGQKYTATARVGFTAGKTIRIAILEITGGAANSFTDVVATGEFQVVSVSHTPAAGVTTVDVRVYEPNETAPINFFIDGVTLCNTSGLATPPIAYFDGDTPGCKWTGTPHASSSTRPAQGAGKKFTQGLNDLESKIEKLNERGGTVKRILPSGDSVVYDVEEATMGGAIGRSFQQHRDEQAITLVCKPFSRGPEEAFTNRTELTLPVLIGTEVGVKGTVLGNGRLTAKEIQGVDRLFLKGGIQMDTFDASADAALYYGAQSRERLNGAVLSDSNTTVTSAPLTNAYSAVIGTRDGTTLNFTRHVGTYEIWARVQAPSAALGDIDLALEHGQGDFQRRSVGAATRLKLGDRQGKWRLVKLGTVRLRVVKSGAQRWEGRVLARSTNAGDTVKIDDIRLIPLDESSFEVRAGSPQYETPPTLLARDEFTAAVDAALAARALPVGGAWAESGDGNAFTVRAIANRAERIGSVNATGRIAFPNGFNVADVAVEADLLEQIGGTSAGVCARVQAGSIANCLIARVVWGGVVWGGTTSHTLEVRKRVGGVETMIASTSISSVPSWYRLRLVVSGGRFFVWCFDRDATPSSVLLAGTDADLTGTLAPAGRCGIYVFSPTAAAAVMAWDNFRAFASTADAVLYANRQAEWRWDGCRRQNIDGTAWVELANAGDNLKVPPSRKDARTLRYIIMASRGDPETMDDGTAVAYDDLGAQLQSIPRYVNTPEAS